MQRFPGVGTLALVHSHFDLFDQQVYPFSRVGRLQVNYFFDPLEDTEIQLVFERLRKGQGERDETCCESSKKKDFSPTL